MSGLHELARGWLDLAKDRARFALRSTERRYWLICAEDALRYAVRLRDEARVSDAEAESAANALCGQPVDSAVSRAYGEVSRG